MKTRLPQFQFTMAFLASSVLFACSDDDPAPTPVEPPAKEGFLELNGGGAEYPNMVFVNLRAEEQQVVSRESWDLGFYTGSEFRVMINGTTGALAYPTGQTDFANVGEELESGLRDEGKLDLNFNNMESSLYADDPKNIFNGTVIDQVSATDSDNQIYILNRGESGVTEKPWKKIRIIRSGNNYVLQHAEIDDEEFVSVEISKDADFNFVYFSFEDGSVNVEPRKQDWDFMWSAGTNHTAFPSAVNGILAYFFQDLIVHNIHGGIGAAQVLEEDVAYEDFDESHISGYTFDSDNKLAVGASWRVTGGPGGSQPQVLEEYYYLVRDASENVYKVRFLSLTKDGERGRPSLEYALVKSDG